MERPKCANMRCQNKGWIGVGAEFYCSDCVIKMDKKQKERLKEEMENAY